MYIEMAEKIKKLDDLEDEDLADAIASKIKSITNTVREINVNVKHFLEEFDRREMLYKKRKEYEVNKKNYSNI